MMVCVNGFCTGLLCYSSVLAMGQSEPDPKQDTTMEFDGREVVVPQGKPIKNPDLKGGTSNFTQVTF